MPFSGKVLKYTYANGVGDISIRPPNFGPVAELWVSLEVRWPPSTMSFVVQPDNQGTPHMMVPMFTDGQASLQKLDLDTNDGVTVFLAHNYITFGSAVAADTVYLVELHVRDNSLDGAFAWYVNGTLATSGTNPFENNAGYDHIFLGQGSGFTWDTPADLVFYFDNFTVGTTRGGTDLWSDNFDSASLAGYTVANPSFFSFVDASTLTGGGGGGGGGTPSPIFDGGPTHKAHA